MSNSTILYLVRHGEAGRNEPEAPLTPEGEGQAERAADFFFARQDRKIRQIISSPFLRALQTADCIGARLELEVETDHRLRERDLGAEPEQGLWEKLRDQFERMDEKFPGGESNRDVLNRLLPVVEALLQQEGENSILVTHRLTMMVLLHHFDPTFTFDQGMDITNPDVYAITLTDGNARVERIWN